MRTPINTIMLGDAYKYTHWLQIEPGTDDQETYGEPRALRIPYAKGATIFGIRGFIQEYLEGEVITQHMVNDAFRRLGNVFFTHKYFNIKGFQRIVDEFGGQLPIRIYAVKEGSTIPTSNIIFRVEAAHEDFVWVTSWVETMLLRAAWYGSTVATVSRTAALIYKKWAKKCGAPLYNPFAVNDFGARGNSSHESTEIGGAAHGIVFLGSDSVECIPWIEKNYYTKDTIPNFGDLGILHSVFATEHSTTISRGEERELDAIIFFLDAVPDEMIASIVIDSYDSERFIIEYIGKHMKSKILARKGKTVFRPDSGDPVEMSLNVVQWLWDIFGGTVNAKGFKVLNPKVGVIYGDGISLKTINKILKNLVDHGFSVENIIFGMGGKLLQGVMRDDLSWAMKPSYVSVNGVGKDIFKKPKTDGGKASKKGRLKLIKVDGKYKTVNKSEPGKDLLEMVFDFGAFTGFQHYNEIREIVKTELGV